MAKLKESLLQIVIVVLLIIETHNTAYGGLARQYFMSTPQNTTVVAGKTAKLSCVVGNMVGSCKWTKDGLSVEGVSRFIIGGETNSNCDLTIHPTLAQDEGRYQCQVSGDYGVSPIISQPVMLTVNSEPGQPYIVEGREEGMVKIEQGEEVELHCESQGGRPPAEIQWWDEVTGRRIVSDVTEHVTRMEDSKTFKTVSKLRFRPDGGRKIQCSAHNEAFPAGKLSHSLDVVVRGHPDEETKELQDGDSIKIFCNNQEQVEEMKIKWFLNDVEITGETRNFLEIEQFSKSYDKSKVKCTARTRNGVEEVKRVVQLVYREENEDPKVLPIKFKDIIKKKQSKRKSRKFPKADVEKKKTMFTCVIEEDEVTKEPKYVWINGKLQKTTEENLVDAADENKKYKCTVIPKGMKKMKKMAKDLKIFTKVFKKISKSLNEIISPIEE